MKLIIMLMAAFAAVCCNAQSVYEYADAYWQFEGTFADQILSDSTGNGNNIFIGTTDFPDSRDASWLIPGFAGNSSVECFFQTGPGNSSGFVSSGADIDALDMIATEPFSVAVWFKCVDITKGVNWLLSKMESSGNYRGWGLIVTGTTNANPEAVDFFLRSTNSLGGRLAVRTVDKISGTGEYGNWMHVAVTYDGSMRAAGFKIYVNGKAMALIPVYDDLSAGSETTCERPFNICARNNVPTSSAYVDELAIWHRELTDGEVLQCITETLPVVCTTSEGRIEVYENTASSAAFQIALTKAPQSDVYVTVTGNALFDFGSGAGYDHILTFTPSLLSQTVTVTAAQNATIETEQIYNIPVTSASSDTPFDDKFILPVQIRYYDDDSPGALVQYAGDVVSVREEGQTSDTYMIVLTSPPAGDVIVTPTYAETDIAITPASCVFTPSNYNVPQTFTVTAVDNIAARSPSVYLVSVNHTFSGDSSYSVLAIDALRVKMYDNDCGASGPFNYADINQDCKVDLADFALFFHNWLDCTIPDVPGCI